MELILRSTAIFFFLWLVTRGMGKRELSQMTAFELLLLVTVGDLIQQGVTQEDTSVVGAMMAVGTIAFWALLFSYLTFRFKRTRPVIEGLPVVIIKDGKVLDDYLRVERMTLEELEEEARNQGIDDLAKVQVGVLEPDGKVSFLQFEGQGAQQQGDSGPDAAS
ncbi:MAG: hypothetical protein QOJ09_2047 [Actinomycetota bacterium]|nr:hypothetical protein [Actinomycetota bacterium]